MAFHCPGRLCLAARYPDKTVKLVMMDAPVPGIPPWDSIVRLPALWHFDFGRQDAERIAVAEAAHMELYSPLP